MSNGVKKKGKIFLEPGFFRRGAAAHPAGGLSVVEEVRLITVGEVSVDSKFAFLDSRLKLFNLSQ